MMRMRGPVLLAAALALQACQHYQPRPPDLSRYPAELAARRLDERPPGSAWTEAELLGAALARAPDVVQARAAYASARAAAAAARVPPAMSLSLTAEYSRNAGGTSPWLFGTLADIPLDYGTRRAARLGTADLVALKALYDHGEAAWSVRMALRRALIERDYAGREIALVRRLEALRRDRADKLGLRLRAGEEARPAVLTAQADQASAERRVLEAEARSRQAELALARALGVEAPAVAGLRIQDAATAAPDSVSLGAWRSEAALSRRDVLRAVADYDQAEQDLRLEVARQYPDLKLDPGYTWERGATKLPVSVVLGLPPYDLNKANIAAADARRAEAGRRLETIQAQVLAAVDQARDAAAAAGELELRARDHDLPIARRTAQSARRALDAGELDRVDLDAAEAAAVEAELTLLEAGRRRALAIAGLEDALRRPFDTAELAALKAASDQLKGST